MEGTLSIMKRLMFVMLSVGMFSGCVSTNNPTSALTESEWQATKHSGKALLPSTESELKIGYAVDAYVQQNFVLLDDSQMTEKIREIQGKLLNAAPARNIAYRIRVLNHNDLNAFSAPGGFVYITYGMLRLMQTENEVAAILAHEIAHVEFRHQMKSYRGQQTAAVFLTGLSLGANFMGSQNGIAGYAQTLGPLGALISLNTFSRAQETQADDYAVRLLVKSGYDPHGLSQALRRIYLEKERIGEGSKLPTIFMTHPATSDRIAYIEQRIDQSKQGGEIHNASPATSN